MRASARDRSRILPIFGAAFAIGAVHCGSQTPPIHGPFPASPGDGGSTALEPLPEDAGALVGFVDLHAHPLSNLGFAGKLVYGGIDIAPDGGALLPADPNCNKDIRATSVDQALGSDQSTHGSWGVDLNPLDLLKGDALVSNKCGDFIREQVVKAVQEVNSANDPGSSASGSDSFSDWPKWNDITHQAMWIDWVQRDFDRGLRVMVALAVNNQTLADAVAGPGDGPDDDMTSADLQLAEIKSLAARHSSWMEVAYTSADLQRIVRSQKLAIVLGLEVDNIGDFNRKPNLAESDVRSEITRLYGEGVRYLFPIHLIDNSFGTTAAYQDIFNLSNLRESGHFWNLVCAQPGDHVTYKYTLGNPLQQTFDLNAPSTLTVELAAMMVAKLGMLSDTFDSPTIPTCATGMVNRGVTDPGLTPIGKFAIAEMMRQGMFIDIDHMSGAAQDDTLAIATEQNYPVNSGHNVVRSESGGDERSMTPERYRRLASLHGMSGLGVANTKDEAWLSNVQAVAQAMGRADGLGLGTDADGMSPLMPPPGGARRFDYSAAFPMLRQGSKSWDYYDAGVANYGMLADMLAAVSTMDGGAAAMNSLMGGAQYLYDEWARIEAYRAGPQEDAGAPARAMTAMRALAKPQCPAGETYSIPCGTCGPPRSRCDKLAPVVCPAGKKQDPWGVCVGPNAKPRMVTHVAAATAKTMALGTATQASALAPGSYTLVLSAESLSTPGRQARSFALDVTATGTEITFHGKKGSAAGHATGGFRGVRFFMRIVAGDHELILIAQSASPANLTELRGGFVAQKPGHRPITGTFALEKTSQLPAPIAGSQSYESVASYLTDLRK